MTPARITGLVGHGPDGACYDGESPDGQQVRVHAVPLERLTPERRAALTQRCALLAAAPSPELWPLLDRALSGPRALVIVGADDTPTLAERQRRAALAPDRAAALALALLRAVRRAHRLHLAHGAIAPSQVWARDDGVVLLDLTGLRTTPVPDHPRPHDPPSLEGDVACTGALIEALLAGTALPAGARAMLTAMQHADPELRPSIGAALRALAPALVTTATSGSAERPLQAPAPGDTLGRYRLGDRLGRGANGEVFRAAELGTGASVAIKVLKAEAMLDDTKLRRFRREARVLAEVRHDNVANLIEVNEDGGVMYLVMELVDGPSLDAHRKARGPLAEADALWIAHDAARGLVAAHERGVIHRDVKPANILLGPRRAGVDRGPFHVRVCDFGVARWLDGEDASLTRGMVVGTPRYMAPEQCTGIGPLRPATDVYALGLVLFDLLTGEPPFQTANSTHDIMRAQVEDAPRRADVLRPEISRTTADLVARCLSKEPADRPADAGAFATEVRALIEGAGARDDTPHPAPPEPVDAEVLEACHEWILPAPPALMWRYISDTERLNRAIGLPAVEWSFSDDPDGVVTLFGEAVQAGVRARWRERPFEWIEGQHLGVLREYTHGPLLWYVNAVDVEPHPGGGTRLRHRLWLKPRGRVWRQIAWIEAKQRLRAKLDRVYPRIAEVALLPDTPAREDPFEEPRAPKKAERRRLESLLAELVRAGAAQTAADALGRVVATWPDQVVARLRPLALARRFGMPSGQMIEACLLAGTIGLLVPMWDVICPSCRIPTRILDSLEAVRAHMSCESCRASFAVDVASSLELTFRPHPEVRGADARTYCIGGPAHSPHAVVQLCLEAGERYRFQVALEDGRYELRTTRDAWRSEFRVARGLGPRRAELTLTEAGLPPLLPVVGAAPQAFEIANACSSSRVLRLERAAERDDAFTAADAAAHPLFMRLYPEQKFGADALVGLAAISLLVTDLHGASTLYGQRGEAAMLGALHRHITALEAAVAQHHGAVVKSVGHGLVAAFARLEDAVRAGLDVAASPGPDRLPVTAAVHRGPAMVATVGGRIDYFGRAVSRAHALLARAAPGQLVVSERVAEEPGVEALWRERGCDAEVLTAAVEPGLHELAVRLKLPAR